MLIIRIEDIKPICNDILEAVDANQLAKVTETLEIKTVEDKLYFNVTNNEYFVQFNLPIDAKEEFHATVEAELFLKLVEKTTVETVELKLTENVLSFKGNGSYDLPLIFEDDKLISLEEIKIDNITSEFDIDRKILNSISTHNADEIQKGMIMQPVQRLYYIDQKGAITFTSGACVNNFTLEDDIKLLLNHKLVSLFKIFKDDTIKLKFGVDTENNIKQSKIELSTDYCKITSIINNSESLFDSIPVDIIRDTAFDKYPNEAYIDSGELIQAIDRLLLFRGTSIKPYGDFVFTEDGLKIYYNNESNFEEISGAKGVLPEGDEYSFTVDFLDIKTSLNSLKKSKIKLKFGNKKSIVIVYGDINLIIPEVVD